MKYLILLLNLFAFSITVESQDIISKKTVQSSESEFSILDQSNFWSVVVDTTSVQVANFNPKKDVISTWYKVGKDTVINGNKVKTLLSNVGPYHHYWSMVGYLRQDNSKIYFGTDKHEILLYDFGLAVGEKMESALNPDFKYVSRLDSIRDTTLNNSVRKIYYLTEYPDFDPTKTKKETWIEGIGSLTDGLLRQTMFGSKLDPILLPNYQLMNFYDNNDVVYQMKRYPMQDNYTTGLLQNLLSANKLWSNMVGPISGCPLSFFCSSYFTKLEGDTIIGDLHYMKVLNSYSEKMKAWTMQGFIRENQKHQVFYRELRSKNEGLIYDFGCKPGQILHLEPESGCIGDYLIDSIGTKIDLGISRKHIYLSYISSWQSPEEWIEGIGSIFGVLNGGSFMHCKIGGGENLLCSFDGSQKTFQSPQFPNYCYLSPEIINGINTIKAVSQIKVYPNPVSGELFIQPISNIDEAYTLEMYTVKGELIKTECLESGSNLYRIDTSSLQNGIYILRLISDSGKYAEKVIVKE